MELSLANFFWKFVEEIKRASVTYGYLNFLRVGIEVGLDFFVLTGALAEALLLGAVLGLLEVLVCSFFWMRIVCISSGFLLDS